MGQRTKFFLGAPWSKKDRQPALEKMREDPLSLQSHLLSVYLNRVTDKTSGVLAIAAVVFAISMFVLDKASKSGEVVSANLTDQDVNLAVFFSAWGILLSTGTILALCLNLTTVWRATLNPTTEDMEAIFHLFCRRAIRLQLSLYGIVIAAFFSVFALGVLEHHLLGGAFSPAMTFCQHLCGQVMAFAGHLGRS